MQRKVSLRSVAVNPFERLLRRNMLHRQTTTAANAKKCCVSKDEKSKAGFVRTADIPDQRTNRTSKPKAITLALALGPIARQQSRHVSFKRPLRVPPSCCRLCGGWFVLGLLCGLRACDKSPARGERRAVWDPAIGVGHWACVVDVAGTQGRQNPWRAGDAIGCHRVGARVAFAAIDQHTDHFRSLPGACRHGIRPA